MDVIKEGQDEEKHESTTPTPTIEIKELDIDDEQSMEGVIKNRKLQNAKKFESVGAKMREEMERRKKQQEQRVLLNKGKPVANLVIKPVAEIATIDISSQGDSEEEKNLQTSYKDRKRDATASVTLNHHEYHMLTNELDNDNI